MKTPLLHIKELLSAALTILTLTSKSIIDL